MNGSMTPEQAEQDFQKELDHGNRRAQLIDKANGEDFREAFRDYMSQNDGIAMARAYHVCDTYAMARAIEDMIFRWADETANEEKL